MTPLRKREIAERQKVLVKRHIVVDILHRRDARKSPAVTSPLQRKSVGQDITPIETRVIVVDLISGKILVGITAVTVERERHGIVHTQPLCRPPCRLPSQIASLLLVGLVSVIAVGVVSSPEIEISRYAHAQILAEQSILRRGEPYRLPFAGLAHYARALIVERRQSVDIDLPGHGVATVQSALRTAYHLHSAHVGQIEVVCILIEKRHIVDRQTHSRLIHARPYAADVDTRSHAAAIVGHIEIGRDLADALQRAYIQTLYTALAKHRRRCRLQTYIGRLFYGSHRHLLKPFCRIRSHLVLTAVGQHRERLRRRHGHSHQCNDFF